ncbi:MAG: DUF6602 domain-containing protein, partial [Thermoplasmata archaeon]
FLGFRVRGCSVGHGQVVLRDGTNSPQLDVIVFDERIASPLFRSGDLVVVHSNCIMAIVEVKSIFAVRSNWEREMGKLRGSFEHWHTEEIPHVFFFCFESDKYTASQHRDFMEDLLKEEGNILDGFFVLQTRDGFNSGELQRFIDAISDAVSGIMKPSRSL